MPADDRGAIREAELLPLVEGLLPGLLGSSQIRRQPMIGPNAQPDFVVEMKNGRVSIVEVKAVTPTTQRRLEYAAQQLVRYGILYEKARPDQGPPELILVVPGVLSDEHQRLLRSKWKINRVIDGPALRAAGATGVAANLLTPGEDLQSPGVREAADDLVDRMATLAPGKLNWSAYQTLCGDVLAFSLCPPLSQPIGESSNRSGVNRRDFVLPNYSAEGFWAYMRTTYNAHFIVVDAKNYVGNVKKNQILQLANYLSVYGTGLFGMIIARTLGDGSAEITRREQWVVHKKLIVLLNDEDLRQMIKIRVASGDPSDVIRQIIEDFRLSL